MCQGLQSMFKSILSFAWIQPDSSNALKRKGIALKRKVLIAFQNEIKLNINLLETSTGQKSIENWNHDHVWNPNWQATMENLGSKV